MGFFNKTQENTEKDPLKEADFDRRLRKIEMRYINLAKKIDRVEEGLTSLIDELENDEDEPGDPNDE